MKVNIVYRHPNEDRILARLARYLRANEWTLGPDPDPKADLNYWIIYIDYVERHRGWHETKTAAYFSHYEEGNDTKCRFWEIAKSHIDIPVITADQYGEGLKNPVKVRVPVDRQFTLRTHRPLEPVIGVSGWVDKSGRKGAHFLKDLRSDMPGVKFTATGHGWPVPTKELKWDELPNWYAGLSLYLCTSTIEGIPMPPLEALACGVPVVIPEGVGMLDELKGAGIYRYEAGNYQRMRKAIDKALTDKTPVKDLRRSVKKYTRSNWCKDHRDGFGAASVPKSRPKPKPANVKLSRKKRGAYVVAYGDPARACGSECIASWKQQMKYPVALVSDSKIGPEDVFIEQPEADVPARTQKIQIYDLAPKEWKQVLYLDADTEVVADVSFLFKPLDDGFDMVICKNPVKYHTTRKMLRPDNLEEVTETYKELGCDNLLQWNGGVFAFARNKRTKAFFDTWLEEWGRWAARDQAALLRALWKSPLKIFTLTNVWNTVVGRGYVNGDPLDYTAGILHFPTKARRWSGIMYHPTDSPEAWQMVKKWEESHVGLKL